MVALTKRGKAVTSVTDVVKKALTACSLTETQVSAFVAPAVLGGRLHEYAVQMGLFVEALPTGALARIKDARVLINGEVMDSAVLGMGLLSGIVLTLEGSVLHEALSTLMARPQEMATGVDGVTLAPARGPDVLEGWSSPCPSPG
jgi:hypothetical protein